MNVPGTLRRLESLNNVWVDPLLENEQRRFVPEEKMKIVLGDLNTITEISEPCRKTDYSNHVLQLEEKLL
jgi:hypothetical protein